MLVCIFFLDPVFGAKRKNLLTASRQLTLVRLNSRTELTHSRFDLGHPRGSPAAMAGWATRPMTRGRIAPGIEDVHARSLARRLYAAAPDRGSSGFQHLSSDSMACDTAQHRASFALCSNSPSARERATLEASLVRRTALLWKLGAALDAAQLREQVAERNRSLDNHRTGSKTHSCQQQNTLSVGECCSTDACQEPNAGARKKLRIKSALKRPSSAVKPVPSCTDPVQRDKKVMWDTSGEIRVFVPSRCVIWRVCVRAEEETGSWGMLKLICRHCLCCQVRITISEPWSTVDTPCTHRAPRTRSWLDARLQGCRRRHTVPVRAAGQPLRILWRG